MTVLARCRQDAGCAPQTVCSCGRRVFRYIAHTAARTARKRLEQAKTGPNNLLTAAAKTRQVVPRCWLGAVQ